MLFLERVGDGGGGSARDRAQPAVSLAQPATAGQAGGAKAWARIASLVKTAKMNRVNPHAYLKATLEAIAAGHPASDIDALMPWAFTSASS